MSERAIHTLSDSLMQVRGKEMEPARRQQSSKHRAMARPNSGNLLVEALVEMLALSAPRVRCGNLDGAVTVGLYLVSLLLQPGDMICQHIVLISLSRAPKVASGYAQTKLRGRLASTHH